jgi:predicted outer membrane repeat protein
VGYGGAICIIVVNIYDSKLASNTAGNDGSAIHAADQFSVTF